MSELQHTLRNLHDELGRAPELGPDDRALLETVLVDIQRVLEAESATDPSTQSDALEDAAVKLEAGHPGLAASIRAVLDALAKAGI